MATEEEKKAAQAQRDAIAVQSNKKEDEVKEPEEKEQQEEEKEKVEVEPEKEAEEKQDEVEKAEKTEEELEAEKVEAKTQKDKDRIQRRIDKEVAKRKELERELVTLKAQLAAKVEEGEAVLTEEDVKNRSEVLADQKVAAREFTNACNRLRDEAFKLDKKFDTKIEAVAEDIGPIPGQMIGILDDLEDDKGGRMGGKVLVHLSDNPDEAERIYALSPAKMAIELAKLSNKLIEKPKPKAISKVPDPNEPVGGNARIPTTILTGKESMEDFVRIRAQQVEARRKAKMGLGR